MLYDECQIRYAEESITFFLSVFLAAFGSLTPENLASLMAAYFFVKFRKFLVRNSVIYDIIRLYHLS